MVKAVIFDVDGTLYNYDEAHASGWEALWFCPTPEQAASHPDADKIVHYDELRRRLIG